MAELKDGPKSDQYDAIRGWVQRTRIDPVKGLPSEEADRFHFTKHDGHISWLTLEPDVKRTLSEGKAGIIAFMSHNGIAHCVVPREVALDVAQVRPEWVRHLDGFEVSTRSPLPSEAPDGASTPGGGSARSTRRMAQRPRQRERRRRTPPAPATPVPAQPSSVPPRPSLTEPDLP